MSSYIFGDNLYLLNNTNLLKTNTGEIFILEIENKKFAANLKTTLETSEVDHIETTPVVGEEYDITTFKTSVDKTTLKTSEHLLEFYESRLKCYLRRTNSGDIIADLFLG